MKKIIFLLLLITSIGFSQTSTTPSTAIANGAVTLNFDKTGTGLASYTGTIYAHIGVTVDGVRWQKVIGTYANNTNKPFLTLVSGNIYKLDLIPDLYAYFGVPTTSSITEICLVLRNDVATLKSSPADIFIPVGAFQATLTAPVLNSNTIINSGDNLVVSANNTNGNADYNLLANGTSITTFTGASFSFTDVNIVDNKNYDLQIKQGTTTFSKKFTVTVNPGIISQTMPDGVEDGINYNNTDATKATLVLDAPLKDFVYVAGSFNNWQPTTTHAMKMDPTTGKFWLELTGLVSGTNYLYQYWVGETTPIANSPSLVKTADPYSTLVVSTEDSTIPSITYANLPSYPVGQTREVTVLQTGQTPYVWSNATTNFIKPDKEKLVVYEVLVRDFDSRRNFQDLIDKIDYFKNLNVNAIELMPVMEFEGNESWGYNTSYHMALDKFYGPSNKMKEFVDLCHQNGIAVILDVALNHAFGRNPMDRMWMNDPDGDGWGGPSLENPYFNTVAMHSYSVGNDFNHQKLRTQYYVKRVIKQWIEEFKIDGLRWDLTKGFTQNCPYTGNGSAQDACTGALQQDRVDVLKKYVDYSWSLDPTHYAIFEHLGGNQEEQEWANYRLNETPSKGVMMWAKLTSEYNELSMGQTGNKSIERMGHDSRGFLGKRLLGYTESHDEERLMYKNLKFGNSSNTSHDVKNLNVALSRMSAIGAISILVPGPKMIWHFGELGWEPSIYSCKDGIVNDNSATLSGDCKLSTKPQPQWTNNWLGDFYRNKIYTDWAKMIALKKEEPVFRGDFNIYSGNYTPRLFIWDNALPETQLKNIVVLTNFDVTEQNVIPDFPYSGTWYNLMDNTSIIVTDVAASIAIPPGGFRIYGNKTASLAIANFEKNDGVYLYPNPSSTYFTLNINTTKVQIYTITGQLIKSFNTNQSNEYQFNINDLSKGLYIVKASDENNEMQVMKFIKK